MAAGATPDWLRRYLDAWSSHDPEQLLACLADDVVVEDRAVGERCAGKDAVRAMYVHMVEDLSSDFRLELGELLTTNGEVWAAEWTMSGTNDREDAARGLPRTGRTFRIQGLSIGRVRDGKVVEDRLYWNLADYLGQLGLVPDRAAATP